MSAIPRSSQPATSLSSPSNTCTSISGYRACQARSSEGTAPRHMVGVAANRTSPRALSASRHAACTTASTAVSAWRA
jgi:hypothetical protein